MKGQGWERVSQEAKNLIQELLNYNPQRRISA